MAKATDDIIIKELKLQADQLNVKYSPMIGKETLSARVNEALMAKMTADIERREKSGIEAPTGAESATQLRARKFKMATRLVRVQVTCFDQCRKDKKGEYIMGGNALVGTIRKYIEFGVPWHMPKILVDLMKEREHQDWVNGKTQFGITQKHSRMVKTYGVQELDVLTMAELDVLKAKQALANNIKED